MKNMKTMIKQSYVPKLALNSIPALVMATALLTCATVGAQQPDSVTLRISYGKGQEFLVPRTDMKIRMDLKDFGRTYDSQIDEKVLVIAGNLKRRMVVKVTVDTLYTDLEEKASEYRDLWWYFYTKDTTLDIGKLRIWEEDKRNWSTHTILTSYNLEINERHYDMFEIRDNYCFHLSIKRPLYLEGDSTLMLEVLNSFEVISPDTAKGQSD